jgi:hypothetical protein
MAESATNLVTNDLSRYGSKFAHFLLMKCWPKQRVTIVRSRSFPGQPWSVHTTRRLLAGNGHQAATLHSWTRKRVGAESLCCGSDAMHLPHFEPALIHTCHFRAMGVSASTPRDARCRRTGFIQSQHAAIEFITETKKKLS